MPDGYFLCDHRPFQHDRRVYQQVAEAELVISERREAASSDDVAAGEATAVHLIGTDTAQ
jgi:hypothetical protein